MLQVLPVSSRVPPSSNKSSLRPWPMVQIDGSSLSSQIHSLCTLPKHGGLPSALLLKRNCVERGLAFSVLIGNNALQEVQKLSTWWQFTLCHCCCSLKWWLNKDFTFLLLSLVTIDALQDKTCTDKETMYLKIVFSLSQPEKQQRVKLKHKKKERSQKPNNQMLPKTQRTNLLL